MDGREVDGGLGRVEYEVVLEASGLNADEGFGVIDMSDVYGGGVGVYKDDGLFDVGLVVEGGESDARGEEAVWAGLNI